MKKIKKTKNIIIVAHKLTTQPDDDLVFFLNKKKYSNVLHIRHSFSDAKDRRSFFTWYKKGKVFNKSKTTDYNNFPEFLIYLKELFFTLKWIFMTRVKWDTYIGMDGLCVMFGNILRSIGQVKKTIYWAIDFVPDKRFESKFKNNIYHFININGYKNSDEMWDLSPRMVDARKKYLNISKSEYKNIKVVPYGVWSDRIKKYKYLECEKNTIVFMGHLLEKQGVQLIIKILPKLIKHNPNIHFKIIGAGRFKEDLIKLAKELKVYKYCDFKGKIKDHRILENEIAKSCIAVAPYIKELDNWTYYADPGKVKTYLACGVPVLLTDLPWNAKDIEKDKSGMIIREDEKDIISKVFNLMDGKKNQIYRDNAVGCSLKFDYKNIFKALEISF